MRQLSGHDSILGALHLDYFSPWFSQIVLVHFFSGEKDLSITIVLEVFASVRQ